MRISPANFITSSKYLGSVFACAMISAVLFFQMELAKCSDRNFSGRPVYLAILEGKSVEELVTSTVFSGKSGANFL